MIAHRDEILQPAVSTDSTAVPRYDVVAPDGQVLYRNVALRLANPVAQVGTPVNKAALDEMLAASGVTAGTATAYTLAQEEYKLFDGAPVQFRLHVASGDGATLNINGTGAKPLRDAMGEAMPGGIPAGTWLKATYSAAMGAYTIAAGIGAASNPNLLDNWYFADPVNSRGLTEYSFVNSYTIDRWKGLNKGALAVEADWLSLTSKETYTGYIRQYLSADIFKNLAGQKITFSALVKGYGRANLFAEPGAGGYGSYKQYDNWDIITLTYTVPTGCTAIFCGLNTPNDNGASVLQIQSVKLELGSHQTLAHQDASGNWVLNDPPPDKGMELLKCIQSTADPNDTYANKTIATTDYALPRDGSKAMTGALNIALAQNGYTSLLKNHNAAQDYGTDLKDIAKDGSYAILKVFAANNRLVWYGTDQAENEVLHTGNMSQMLAKADLSNAAGTFGGAVKANAAAAAALGDAQVRNVTISATDLTADSSALATGSSYHVYS